MFSFVTQPFRPFYCLLYGPESQDNFRIRCLRRLLSFLLGLVLGHLLWKLVALNFSLGRLFAHGPTDLSVFTIFVLLTGTAFMLSRSTRTVIMLIFVALVGKSGRTYFRAVAFAFIISGPIDNLVANAGEVARVFVCTTMLTYNLSKTRFDLMAKPFTNTLKHMRGDVEEIRQTFGELQGVLVDLKYAVEHSDIEDDKYGDKKTKPLYERWGREARKMNISGNGMVGKELPTAAEAQERFQRNMRNRCKHQLQSGHRVCLEVFQQGYRKCTTNFPPLIGKAICWPYRVDIICELDLFGNPDKICDPSDVVPRNFGETYVQLLKAEQELFDNSSEIQVSYEVKDEEIARSKLQSAQRTSEAFTKDFERRRRIFNRVMGVLQKILCLFMLRMIFVSINYYLKYLGDVEFDNFYITDYFKHVDQRRKDERNDAILPLRTYEKSMYIDLSHIFSRTHEESTTVFFSLIQFLLEIVTAGLFILIDHMVVELLQIIRMRSLITYHQEGEHEVRFNISGVGQMARLLRTTMHNFNIHERVSTSLTNEECLPDAHVLPRSFYYKLLLLYLVILLLIYQSTTFLRMRRMICSFFYYKREKQRILFLYNRILRSRLSSLENLVRSAEDNLATYRVQQHVNLFLWLRFSCPSLFGWLRFFKCAKRNCLICQGFEDATFTYCHTCGVSYCDDCAEDLNSVCLQCGTVLSRIPEDSDSSVEVYAYRKEK
ncbi:protein sneaky [Drosophila rhopaloa]|uniref:Dendritic cell-specific transmembrane protein-like domain-containing protein n=1 Tax=Drosophila rhopaloa TaxID=1041015 RepID=A0ABM5HI47_DRORH|nr:protein sneaky [Drosophila rhopaloa]